MDDEEPTPQRIAAACGIPVTWPPIARDNMVGDHLPPRRRGEQTMGMPASAAPRRWTAAQVRDLIREDRAWPRYELIDGELLVTPSPLVPHQRAVRELLLVLTPYVNSIGVPFEVFSSPADLELEPDTIVQPDVFVAPFAMPGEADAWASVRRLLLAIEILSPSTARYDRTVKRRFFVERVDVAEYWIVDLDARVVERWRHGETLARIDDERLEWLPEGATEPLAIDLLALFARVQRKG
jgi:Uma2 family endonuclease